MSPEPPEDGDVMNEQNGPTLEEATGAIQGFALAAGRLLEIWWNYRAEENGVDGALTETYPKAALPMSFDEIVTELWAWNERMLDRCAEAQAARVAAKEDARVREALGLVP